MNLARLLDHPMLWEFSRLSLDRMFGVYSSRIRLMREWRCLEGNPSVLDLGCGIGHYSSITRGRYLGVDLNERYLEHARRRRPRQGAEYRCADVTVVATQEAAFDLVLIVDVLHHLPNTQCLRLLRAASALAPRHVVSFEPVSWQPNPLGRLLVHNDRGKYVRSLGDLHQLFQESGLRVAQSSQLWLGPFNTRAIHALPARSGDR